MEWNSDLVPFRITVCGIDELVDFAEVGVSHVLSILDPDYPEPDAFARYPAHAKLELRFHDVIEERAEVVAPRRSDVDLLLAFGRDLLEEPSPDRHLLVHCHMGISRSTAAMVLMLAQARPEISARALIDEVVRIRPRAWPNLRMVTFGDALLRRDGALIAAAHGHYAERVAEQPELERYFRSVGREGELARLKVD